jgi:hypothetical protein
VIECVGSGHRIAPVLETAEGLIGEEMAAGSRCPVCRSRFDLLPLAHAFNGWPVDPWAQIPVHQA